MATMRMAGSDSSLEVHTATTRTQNGAVVQFISEENGATVARLYLSDMERDGLASMLTGPIMERVR